MNTDSFCTPKLLLDLPGPLLHAACRGNNRFGSHTQIDYPKGLIAISYQ